MEKVQKVGNGLRRRVPVCCASAAARSRSRLKFGKGSAAPLAPGGKESFLACPAGQSCPACETMTGSKPPDFVHGLGEIEVSLRTAGAVLLSVASRLARCPFPLTDSVSAQAVDGTVL